MVLVEIKEVVPAKRDAELLWGHSIDRPRSGDHFDGRTIDVLGWVLGRSCPAVAVELVHAGTVVRHVPMNQHRPDLAEAFPHVLGADQAGFRARLSVLGTVTELDVEVLAVLQDQTRVPLSTIRLRRGWSIGEDERAGAALVSVIIPCYNQARFLDKAIESVLAQTYPHIEIVVVDDGSADNTEEIANRYPGVRCVRQENRGLAEARNTGLRRSNGSYLIFLDADDRLLPTAVELGLANLRAHPGCAFASGQCRLIAVDGSPQPSTPPVGVEDDPYLTLLQTCYIAHPAVVIYRRPVFEAVGGFDPKVNACADYDLYLRVAREHPVCCHEAVVAEYRQHGSNMTLDAALMLQAVMTVLRRQRRYAKTWGRRYEDACRTGQQRYRQRWGIPLAEETGAQLVAGEWRRPLHGLAMLLRYHPRATARLLPPAITRARALLGQPPLSAYPHDSKPRE